jgi:hypothetical protein
MLVGMLMLMLMLIDMDIDMLIDMDIDVISDGVAEAFSTISSDGLIGAIFSEGSVATFAPSLRNRRRRISEALAEGELIATKKPNAIGK